MVNLVSESLEHAKTNSLISLGYGDADEGIFPIFVSTSPSAIIQGPELSSLQRDYSPNNFTISNSFLNAKIELLNATKLSGRAYMNNIILLKGHFLSIQKQYG